MPRPLVALLLLSLVCACGPTFERASDDPSIDEPAMSTKLDRADLELALQQWYEEFDASAFVGADDGSLRTISVLEVENRTSEHISSGLAALIQSVETRLVNSGDFAVVGNDELVKEAIAQQHQDNDLIDPATMAAVGKRLGVQYFVSGLVGDTTEKTDDTRRVQYYLFLKVTEVETLRIVFQSQIDITKQVSG